MPAFFSEYHRIIAPAALSLQSRDELSVLFYAHLLEKALYELAYELNNRPEWVQIPLQGLQQLLELQGL